MGTRHVVPFYTSQQLRVMLMLIIGFGFYARNSSCSSEVVTSKLARDSQNSNTCTSCSLKTFVMKPYFDKYEMFLDTFFEEFVSEELLHGACKELPENLDPLLSLSITQRQLIGEGSHQHISSTIRFNLKLESQLHSHFCQLIAIEKLPYGVFADPFELQHLLERGAYSDVAVFGDTNLELPSVRSNRTVVEIHMNAGTDHLLGDMNRLQISIDLPFHARYPPLNDTGYSIVEFSAPSLFIHCSVEGTLGNQSCLFQPTITINESKACSVLWAIPSGIRPHIGTVSVVTFVAALVSTLLILLASIFWSDCELYNIQNSCSFL